MRSFLSLVVAFFLFAGVAQAATTPNSVITPQVPNRGIVQFTSSSSAGTYSTLYTAGANGSKCFGMWTSSNDSVTHLLTVQIVNGGVKYGGSAITVAATAGFATGIPPQSVTVSTIWPGLPVDNNGNAYIELISGDTLQATFATAITATDLLNVVVTCADY